MTGNSTAGVGMRVFYSVLFLIACAAPGQPNTPGKAGLGVPTAPGANVPNDWWSTAQKGIAQSEYNITWQEQTAIPELGAAWQAPNRAHDLRTYFTDEGPRVIRRRPEAGSWTWGLELTEFGSADGDCVMPPVQDVCTEGNRITFERAGLAEWYVNTPAGLEQGFTVFQAPRSGDAVVVRMAVRGDLSANMTPDGQSVEFLSAGGVGVMHYGKLQVTDAAGRTLPATMTLSKGTAIELRVDTSGAAFPVTIDPLATSAAWTGESNQAEARFGLSVSTAGDVNGDGYSDVIVGAPTYDTGQTDEGCVFVYHGSSTGLAAAPNWSAEANQVNAYFGWSVATAGDVNGDGYSDVIIGAIYYDNGQTDEGRAYVYHGSASGLSATANWTAESNQAASEFGVSVSTAGDVNGDGFGDVIVGADFYDNGQTNEGRVFVYYGTAKGLAAAAGWTAEVDQASANFGYSVSTAGDVNGDGYADLIVGAPFYDNTLTDEGRVVVYAGSAAGVNSTPLRNVYGGQANAWLGCSVSTVGDINGDGYSDVAMGAYGYDNGETDEGRACVYLGNSKGLATSAAWTAESDQNSANFGWAVGTAGDVNGDGYADVIVSAPTYDNGETDEGRVSVYYGSSSGLSATANWTAESDQAGAKFGYSAFTAGDVNGDGHSDVIVGAPFYDNGETDEGRAFVYYGSASSLSGTARWTAESNQASAKFGYSVASAGDVNGDGYADVIVGAPYYDNGQTDEGRVYVYHGSATGLSATENWWTENDQAGAKYGYSVASAGDVNGDGYGDVIIGAPNYEGGWAYAYHGSATGLSATPNWNVRSTQAGASFGYCVSTAGDVNGDGYADVIVGAPNVDNGGFGNTGMAFILHGSASGLATSVAWSKSVDQTSAWFGSSVSTAGDVNRDGYSDIIVGAPGYDSPMADQGRAYVYLGSASGVSTTENRYSQSNKAGAEYGASVSTAGDVNGDGYADVIVGAPLHNSTLVKEGMVVLCYGYSGGIGATYWYAVGGRANIQLGYSVSTAGDVNGDGYADIIVGAPYYGNSESGEGRAYVYHGSSGGLLAGLKWSVESNQVDANLGFCVSTAGDVNGDGYADVIVGTPKLDYGETDEGLASVYYGNGEAGGGMTLNPRQRRGDDSVAIAPMGLLPGTSVRLAAKGRTPFGRGKAKLECETKFRDTLFDGAGTAKTASWTSTGVAGASFSQVISMPSNGVRHWRARLCYNPATTPFQQYSRWFTMPWEGWQQGDFRVIIPKSAAPSSPGATAISTTSITWTWTDNSTDETGFKVWSDPGSGAPGTLRTTTAAGVTSYLHGGLSANTQHAFQVAATNNGGDSDKTAVFSSWTLANVPAAPTVNGVALTTLNVAVGAGDSNPAATTYAIRHANTNKWVQANGALGASAVYQTTATWGTVTVTGLASATSHNFVVVARNGANTVTAEGPGASAITLASVPGVVGMTEAEAGAAITGASLTVGAVMQVYSNTVPVGRVILQSPEAGQAEPITTAVNLTVSLGPVPVTVPNVAGLTQAAAGAALVGANLTAGTVTQQCSNTVAAGLVISQTPPAGQQAPSGSAVVLVVSSGLCNLTVPNVTGMTQAAAGAALVGANLTTGAVTQECSNTVAAGLVISQTPAADAQATFGSAVVLVVSTGLCNVTVPNVTGLTQAAADTALVGANLITGTITQQCSNTVAAGSVVSQTPAADEQVIFGGAVALVVSTGLCNVTVPNVTGLTQTAAGTALVGANLITGTITQQCSNTVATGLVISQTPAAEEQVIFGGAVALVVSTGPCDVTVPNVAGLAQAAADTALLGASLTTGAVTQQCSNTVAAGLVISQTPAADQQAAFGSAVALVVSTGLCDVAVPNVVGMTQAAADAVLVGANLGTGTVTQECSNTLAAGLVISQMPAADQQATFGAAVALVVSTGSCDVTVPDVVGLTQVEAGIALIGANLTTGAVTQECSNTLAAGLVISQIPSADQQAAFGGAVALVVSTGPCNATVPNVAGLTQAAADAALVGANLTTGTLTQECSNTVEAGLVISQSPAAEQQATFGGAVALVVSTGLCNVTIPNVVGLPQAAADTALLDANLTTGMVTQQCSDTVAAGSVISQIPAADQQATFGGTVALVVSTGPCNVTVPDVVGLTQAAADTALLGADLVSGMVTQECSNAVVAGLVISQTPAADQQASFGGAVALVVSTGPCTVTVPNVVGLLQAAADTVLLDANLTTGTVTQECSNTVAAGLVISQTPAADQQAALGGVVALVVSTGPCNVTVPNVVGLTQAAADAALLGADLATGAVTQQCSNTLAAGLVISQIPAADQQATLGGTVALVVSTGPCNVTVPDVAGLTQAAADTALIGANLSTGTVTQQCSNTVSAGLVISQTPAADQQAAFGSAVALVVSTGPCNVTVPNVVGLAQAAADTALIGANLSTGTVTQQCSNTVAAGLVISQTPAADQQAAFGSTVALVVSTGRCNVTVPNVVGLTQAAADTALIGASLGTGTATQQCSNTVSAGLVISQTPAADQQAAFGSAVALVVSTGPCNVTVPNVVGLTQAEAGAAFIGANLITGAVTQQCSDTVSAGLVISQTPAADQQAALGSTVALLVSVGPCNVTVPNVVGLTQAAAGAAFIGANLSTGTVTQQCSDTVAAGLVISQTPAADQQAALGSTVALVISTGPCTVTVPSVVGLTQAAAGVAFIGANLSTGAVTQQCSDTVAAGLVLSQTPAADEQAAFGSAVALAVSSGPCTVEGEVEGENTPPTEAELRDRLTTGFNAMDTNGDGKISFAEAQAVLPGLTQAVFNAVNTSGNGQISRTEAGLDETGPGGCAGCSGGRKDVTSDTIKQILSNAFLGGLSLVVLLSASRRKP